MKRNKAQEEKILAYLAQELTPTYLPPHVRGGHDVTHIERMCAIAEKIAEDGFDIFLLKVAIWFHNLDRSTHPDLGGGATRKHEYIERVIRGMLSNFPNEFGVKEIAEIIDAVLKHHKLNHDSDSPLLVHLKDCDRLDIGAIGILRTGAHRHDIPPYDKSDFAKHSMVTREAELPTMIHGLHFNLEWEAMLRLPKAKILGKSRFDFIRTFLTMCQMELYELGLLTEKGENE